MPVAFLMKNHNKFIGVKIINRKENEKWEFKIENNKYRESSFQRRGEEKRKYKVEMRSEPTLKTLATAAAAEFQYKIWSVDFVTNVPDVSFASFWVKKL